MRVRRLLTALAFGLGAMLTVGLLVSVSQAAPSVRLLLVPGNPVTHPTGNTTAAPPTTTVSITYDEAIDPTTVSTRTFAVFASQTGLRTQTYGVSGPTIALTPTQRFRPGELVQVSATTGTLNLSAEGPLAPTVWQFRAAVGGGTGVFSDSGQALGSSRPWDVALGDVDGDDDLDVLVGGYNQATRIWLNKGGIQGGASGVFTDSGQTLGISSTLAVALGDLDKDGDLDAFVGNDGQANTVWLNDGDGVFSDSSQALGSSNTMAVALGDVDGDGDLDAFVGNDGQANRVWLNDGAGGFADSGQALGSLSTRAVALGDLDGDGDLDAFTANFGQANRVWSNSGGVFADSGQALGNSYSNATALGDVDDDGDLDAVVGNAAGEANRLWLNQGGTQGGTPGVFGSGQALDSSSTYAVALGDLDGDGDLDVFHGNDDQPNTVWLNSSGVFTDSGQRLGSSATLALALGDVDGDGDLDAFAGNYNQADKVWINDLRDLTIESLVIAPASPPVDVPFSVTVTVRNQGTGDVLTGFNTVAYIDHVPSLCDGGAGSWASQDTVSLTAGSSVVLTFVHPGFAVSGQHTIYAQVDTHCVCDNNPSNDISGPHTFWIRPFTVTATSPVGNGAVIARDGVISAAFSEAVDSSTVTTHTFAVRGRQTGVYEGSYTFGSVQFDGTNDFKPGEEIVVNLSSGIRSTQGSGLTPHAWQFRAAVEDIGTGAFGDSGQTLGSGDTSAVALGDVDGDGDLDAFIGNYGQASKVWLNNGGVFGSGQTLGVSYALAVALGDVDGDGDLDAFVGNRGQANKVWLNDGGVFADSGQTLGISDTVAVALGDVDGDGDLDAFVGNSGEANRVWLNDGGVFADSGQRLGDASTTAVALGDVDGDGDLDAVIGNYWPDPSKLWLNDGAGVFSDSGQYLEWFAARAVALGDVDGDGDLDIFMGILGRADWIWLNDGAGGFSDSGQRLGSSDTNSVALGDVDGDGDLDAFAGNSGGPNAVWLNNGTGVFADSGQSLGAENTRAVALGDVDGDGDLDAFVGNDGQANQIWLNSLRDLVIESLVVEPTSLGLNQPFAVTVTIRNQGTAEISTGFSTAVYSDRVPSPCDGGAGSWDSASTPSLAAGASAVLAFAHPGFASTGKHAIYAQVDTGCVADQNLDNNVAGPQTIWVNVFTVTATSPPGNGAVVARGAIISATFNQAVNSSTVSTRTFTVRGRQTGVYEGSYTFGSVQFDAADDFEPGEEIEVHLSDGIRALDGRELLPYTWQFRAAVVDGTGVLSDSGQRLGALCSRDAALGDLDRDGDLDAFVGNQWDPNRVWLNDGAGLFTDSGQTMALSQTMAVALGDLDGDGDLDAFVGNGSTYGAEPNQVWLNAGGVFTDSGQKLGNSISMDVALGDVDGDGDLDAFVGNSGQANRVWLNDGTGVFTDSGQAIDSGSATNAVVLGDVDGDGDLDAFMGNYGEANRVWLNDGAGYFTGSGQGLGSGNTNAVALGDVDSDGDLDAFSVNSGQANRVWLNSGGVFADSGQALGNSYSHAVALGDVDGDGDLDAYDPSGGANGVWLNDGSGVFADSGRNLGTPGGDAVALGDVDGDGDLDAFIAIVGECDPNQVWLNNKNTPTAQDDHFAVPADSGANPLGVLANDSDGDGDALTIVALGTPSNGSATIGAGTVLYTPTLSFTGVDVFTYTVSDPGELADTATVTVTVGGANNPPVAQDDSATTNEDTPVTIDVLGNDSDPDGQVPFVVDVGMPASGSAVIDNNKVVYTPLPNVSGTDVFTYAISDGWMADMAAITVTVNPVEDLPTLDPLPDLAIDEDGSVQTVTLTGITSGAPDENQTLTVTADATPYDGADLLTVTVAYVSPNTTGILSIVPVPDRFGASTVGVFVNDGVGQIERTFHVTVNPVNDPPRLNPISDLVIAEDAGEQVVALSGISYGPTNEHEQRPDLAVTASSTNIGLIPHPTVYYDNGPGHYVSGRLGFTPVANRSGLATVVVTVTDRISETVRSFQVIVNAVNDSPTLDAISDLTIDEDAGVQTVSLSGIGSGAPNESQLLAVTAVSTDTSLIPNPAVTYASPNPTGALSFAPVADRFGTATVIVTVNDGISETARAFQVTVNPINDPPTLDPIAGVVIPDDAVTATVGLTGIGAGPYESQAVTVTASSTNLGLLLDPGVTYTSPDPTGALTLTRVPHQFGPVTVIVTVTDGLLETARTFLVTLADPFWVVNTNPPGNGRAFARTGVISVAFSWPVDSGTVSGSTFIVRGRQTGVYGGSFAFNPLRFDAVPNFKPGEEIVVNLNDGIRSTGGKPLIPYAWQFRAAVGGGTGVFVDSGQAPGYYGDLPLALMEELWPQSVLDSQAVALGDVDGDGDLDAYVVKNGAYATVWLNVGGVYVPSGQQLGSAHSWAVALGDLDGDGDLDAFVGNYGAGNTVWRNNGAGVFADSGQRLGSADTYAVALGDVDGDGDLDAVVGNDVGQPNEVWLNDGTGAFDDSQQSLGYRDARAVALGDLDGDGDLDVFLGHSDGRANEVWLNDGGDRWGTWGRFTDSGQRLGSADTYAVALGDLDGDSDLDAFIGNGNGEANEVWRNDGSGAFSDSGQRLGSSATWAVALGDLDADGDLDAFVGNVRYGAVSARANRVWRNDGSGVFSGGQSLGDEDSLSVALGDVDGDGDLDGFVGNSNGLYQTNKLYLNQSLVQSVVVGPTQGGTLVYAGEGGSATIVDVPAGAVSKPTEFRYVPIATLAASATGLRFVGQSFALEAYQEGDLVPDLTLSTPLTITVHYSEADVVGLDEGTLELRHWDGSEWTGDGIALVERDSAVNRLVVTVSHPARFALFGQGQRRFVYLPLVMQQFSSASPGLEADSMPRGLVE